MKTRLLALCVALAGCGAEGYAAWPAQDQTFPWVTSPDPAEPPYAKARWETETWDLESDSTMAGFYLEKFLDHYVTAPPEVMQHFEKANKQLPKLGSGIVLSFSGDILYVGGNWSEFGKGAGAVNGADLRIGNLETSVSSLTPAGRSSFPPVRYNAPVEVLDNLPIDVLQLNNNHTLDADDAGAQSTKANVLAKGYRQTGIDEHLTVDVGGHKVALVSFTWGVNRRDYQTKEKIFIVPFGHLDEEIDLSDIGARIDAARAGGAEYVVLMLHWGFEYEHYPHPQYLKLARQMIALGADVIAAEGPHVVQPAEVCWVNHPEKVPGIGTCSIRSDDGKPRLAAVLYSLGNFSNDAPDRMDSDVGIVAKVSLDGGQVTGASWTPIWFQLTPKPHIDPLEARLDDVRASDEFARLQKHLGTSWHQAP